MNVLTTKREVEERDVISVLELFNIKTNERTVVATFDELIEAPNWLKDGKKHVVYISYNKNDINPGDHPANKNVEIRMMSPEGGEYKTLVKLFGGQGTINVNSWSPDSSTFAFVSYKLK